MSDVFGSLAPSQDDPILPQPRNPAMPADWAQEAVRKVLGGLANLAMAPRRAMDQGMTTEQAVPWAGEMALNMAGAGGLGAAPGAVGAAGGRLVQPQGIRAYHGSPHDFERFDLSKIGTGEGAQSYGHGLYFAENEAVAKQYRDAITAAQNRRPATINMPGNPFSGTQILEADPTRPGRMYEVNINAKPEQFLDWDRPLAADHPARQAAVETLKPPGLFTFEPERTLREARRDNVLKPEATGADVYQAVSRGLAQGKGFKPSEATSVMREAGIPGIKYLDQGSRGVTGAKPYIATDDVGGTVYRLAGHPTDFKTLEDAQAFSKNPPQTSNYVVFDDKLIDILRKYGITGMLGGGAASQATGDAPAFGALAR